jgi:hypothetical protein
METGYQLIFWGIFLMTVHINIGNFQILPQFIGWAMVAGGISKLNASQAVKEYNKASVFAVMGVIYSIINFIWDIEGLQTSNFFLASGATFIGAVELFTEYYIIQGSAGYLNDRGNKQYSNDLIRRINKFVTIYIIILAALFISLTLYSSFIMTLCSILAVAMRIWYLVMIYGLKKYYSWKR